MYYLNARIKKTMFVVLVPPYVDQEEKKTLQTWSGEIKRKRRRKVGENLKTQTGAVF